jgi:hypothetical protein
MTSPIEPEKRAFAVVVGNPDLECDGHIWEPGVECLGVLVVESEDIQADLGAAKRIASRLTQAVSESLREKDARIRELEGALKRAKNLIVGRGHSEEMWQKYVLTDALKGATQ